MHRRRNDAGFLRNRFAAEPRDSRPVVSLVMLLGNGCGLQDLQLRFAQQFSSVHRVRPHDYNSLSDNPRLFCSMRAGIAIIPMLHNRPPHVRRAMPLFVPTDHSGEAARKLGHTKCSV